LYLVLVGARYSLGDGAVRRPNHILILRRKEDTIAKSQDKAAKPAPIPGFFLDAYRAFCKPQKLDEKDPKIPKDWFGDKEEWKGIEFAIKVEEGADGETVLADLLSQVKDGLKRRQQEIIRYLMGRETKAPARTKDHIALMDKIYKEGKVSITLHDLVNWKEHLGIEKKRRAPKTKEELLADTAAEYKATGMSKEEIIAAFEKFLT